MELSFRTECTWPGCCWAQLPCRMFSSHKDAQVAAFSSSRVCLQPLHTAAIRDFPYLVTHICSAT